MTKEKQRGRHGTLYRYVEGCSCPRCLKAKREYQKGYRDRHPERKRASGRLRSA